MRVDDLVRCNGSVDVMLSILMQVKLLLVQLVLGNVRALGVMRAARRVMTIVLVRLSPVVSGLVRRGRVIICLVQAMNVILHLLVMMMMRKPMAEMLVGVIAMQEAMQGGTVVMAVTVDSLVVHMTLIWLHLDDKVASASVYISRVENATISLEATAGLVPSTTVEGIEVIAPMELKLVYVLIVREDLDVVVEDVPRHIYWIESSTPRVEGRSPEVHSERLGLFDEANCLSSVVGKMADFLSIDGKRDVVRGPLELVRVPVVTWIEVVRVVMVLQLVMAITVDHVCRERIGFDRWHDLDI